MKRLFLIVLLTGVTMAAQAMDSAPIFCIGQGINGVTAEGTRTVMTLNIPSVSGSDSRVVSQRVMLTARNGVLPFVDLAGKWPRLFTRMRLEN